MGGRLYCAEIYMKIYLYFHSNMEYYYLSFFQNLFKCTYAEKTVVIAHASLDSHADGLIQL